MSFINNTFYKCGSQSQNEGQKRRLADLTLTVVVELLNAALAASTVRVILPTVLFLRATFKKIFYIIRMLISFSNKRFFTYFISILHIYNSMI